MVGGSADGRTLNTFEVGWGELQAGHLPPNVAEVPGIPPYFRKSRLVKYDNLTRLMT